jgi:uncharacterized protein YggU (UPF0235/DUF167 family)
LRVSVRLTPKGGRDAVEGLAALSDGSEVMKARVRAAPEDGAANAALAALLAKTLGVGKSAVTLRSGHSARVKVLDIAGDGAALAARLEAALKEGA